MSGSIKRIGAILIKELQDIKSNPNVLVMYFLPILIFIIYKGLIGDMPASMTLAFALVMLVGEVCVFVPAMLIAEEKEKKTLNALLLSPARPVEVFSGKGLLTFISVVLIAVILSVSSGIKPGPFAVILVGTVLVTVTCTLLGMIVGLYAQNQMATGMLGLPFILPFILFPFLTLLGNTTLTWIARIIPTYYYFRIISLTLDSQKSFMDLLPHMGILVVFIAISLGLLLLIYRKRGFES